MKIQTSQSFFLTEFKNLFLRIVSALNASEYFVKMRNSPLAIVISKVALLVVLNYVSTCYKRFI